MRMLVFSIIPFSILVFGACYFLFPETFYGVMEYIDFFKGNIRPKKIKINKNIVSYVEKGTGETIVFIHGFQSNKWFWKKYIDNFKKTHHVISPDLPSHGGTTYVTSDKLDLDFFADFINEFANKKKLDKFVIAGISLGGAIATTYAHKYPNRVKKLILLNPVGIRPEDANEVLKIKNINEKLFFPKNLEEFDQLYLYLLGRKFIGNKFIKRVMLRYLLRKQKEFKKVFAEIVTHNGIQDKLVDIDKKTLLIMGEFDKVSGKNDIDVYRSKLANCNAICLEKAHHIFQGEEVNKAIFHMEEFLKKD